MYCLSVVNCLETDLSRFQVKCFSSEICFCFVVTFVILNERTDVFAALCAVLGEVVFSETQAFEMLNAVELITLIPFLLIFTDIFAQTVKSLDKWVALPSVVTVGFPLGQVLTFRWYCSWLLAGVLSKLVLTDFEI